MRLTKREAEYLKTLYMLRERGIEIIPPKIVAKKIKVSIPAVVEMLKRLSAKGLVEYIEWRGVRLSDDGLKIALRITRAHRLMELLLVKVVGIDVKTACKEVSSIDFLLSEEVVDSICKFLGHPSKCPHGRKIPRSAVCCGEDS